MGGVGCWFFSPADIQIAPGPFGKRVEPPPPIWWYVRAPHLMVRSNPPSRTAKSYNLYIRIGYIWGYMRALNTKHDDMCLWMYTAIFFLMFFSEMWLLKIPPSLCVWKPPPLLNFTQWNSKTPLKWLPPLCGKWPLSNTNKKIRKYLLTQVYRDF